MAKGVKGIGKKGYAEKAIKKNIAGVQLKTMGANGPINFLTTAHGKDLILGSSRPLFATMTEEEKTQLIETDFEDSKVDIKSESWLDRENNLKGELYVPPKKIERMKQERKKPIKQLIREKRNRPRKPFFSQKAFDLLLKCEQITDWRQAHKLASDAIFSFNFLKKCGVI